jgi:hypothetical protein
MKTIRNIIIILAIVIIAITAGIFIGRKMQLFKSGESESSQVMLEKVARVFKLVAVEAHVSEIYDYKQYNYWDVNFLRKKALVRVRAKVSIGYDFEDLELVVDENSKTIRLVGFPEPEVLSVDHDLDYYDMDEGLFNSFTGDDLTKLNRRAKEYAVSMIEKSELYEQAEAQKDEIIAMMRDLFQASGWQLETEQEDIIFRN